MFYESGKESIPYFRFEELDSVSGLVHAFTSRKTDQAANLADPRDGVFEKIRFVDSLGVDPDTIVQARQVHSSRILLDHEILPSHCPEGDGLLVAQTGRFGVIRTADCVPALIVDPERRRVGLIHAGWKGTAQRILGRGLQRILADAGGAADRLIVAIGPCIRACCYEVGDEVRRHYGDLEHDLDSVFVGHHLDLVASNRAQAEAAGVTRILDCGLCTSCRHSTFYSYRRKQDTGRQWMLAGFR